MGDKAFCSELSIQCGGYFSARALQHICGNAVILFFISKCRTLTFHQCYCLYHLTQSTHISDSARQKVDSFRVAQSHCAGAIDLDDPVPNTHTTPLSNGASQQRTYLAEQEQVQRPPITNQNLIIETPLLTSLYLFRFALFRIEGMLHRK